MSSNRSSSVRGLRSIFENKDTDSANSPDSRGRSPSHFSSKEGSRPLSKVRSSFVNVEPNGKMAASQETETSMPPLGRVSSAANRRGSFSVSAEDHDALGELKKVVSREHERREEDSSVAETIPESAVEGTPLASPAVEPRPEQAMGEMQAVVNGLDGSADTKDDNENENEEEAPAHPDKPVTSVEEEAGSMKLGDPTNEDAVSGGEALPPVAEDLKPQEEASFEPIKAAPTTPKKSPKKGRATFEERPDTASKAKPTGSATTSPKKQASAKPTTNGKPPPISPRTASKAPPSALKSPASVPKSPNSLKSPSSTKSSTGASAKLPSRKSSRASLTAPTASSAARTSGVEKRESLASKTSTQPKPKPRETTKAANIPSHLMAPTAASKAKHEAETTAKSASSGVGRSAAPTATRTPAAASKSGASTKPTSRPSLGAAPRPESRSAQAVTRKPPPADGSFLERMMRPTAASASKAHEKVEAKSPPRRTKSVVRKSAPSRPHANGVAAKSSKTLTAKLTNSRMTDSLIQDDTKENTVEQPGHESAVAEQVTDALNEGKNGPGLASNLHTEEQESKAEALADAGNFTPDHQTTKSKESEAALEATPAFSENEIR